LRADFYTGEIQGMEMFLMVKEYSNGLMGIYMKDSSKMEKEMDKVCQHQLFPLLLICSWKLMSIGVRVNADGSKYNGEYKEDKPNGTGCYIWCDGEKYDGEWRDGKFNGKGIKTLPDGTIFDGKWLEGKPNGPGTCNYPDGATYNGEWKNGQPHGKGE
jgi:hypothetical protein